jgi:CHAT domain-containing protein
MLIVALPSTPGLPYLPAVDAEQAAVAAALPGRHTTLPGPMATHTAILDGIAGHHWVHVCCHGAQDLRYPSDSGLVPYDWQSAGPVTVTNIIGTEHPGGELIYMSACKTATSGIDNTNEVITLAAGLHYVGWRHAIATLWSVRDSASADVAALVYAGLVDGADLKAERSAKALHTATRAYREAHQTRPSRWMHFIHIGP